MMLVEPIQKKVTTIASPLCGFVGLNPLSNLLPARPSVLFCWSRVMSPAADCSTSGARWAGGGAVGALGRGLSESLHAAATKAAASSLGMTLTVVRCPGRRVMAYKSNMETILVSEPEAPSTRRAGLVESLH